MAFLPLEQPNLDIYLLDGKPSPGLSTIDGAGSPRKIEQRLGYGLSGAISFFRGAELSEFSISTSLYTDADWAAWHAFSPSLLTPPRGQRPVVRGIYHPILADLKIDKVLVKDLTQPVQSAEGVWTFVAKFVAWQKLKAALKRPEGVTSVVTDPVEIKIGVLSNQSDTLARERDALP